MVVSSVTPRMDLALAPYQPGFVLQALLDGGEQHLLLLVAGAVEEPGVAALRARAEVDQQGGIAAVVEDHVGHAAVAPLEDAVGIVPVLLQRLALDGEHRRAAGGDGGGSVVLGRVDVAGGPAHVGAERPQRLDQHGGLDRHVQGAGHAGALQWLRGGVFLAGRHQPRHLGLGDGELLAAPIGEPDVLDHVVVATCHAVSPRGLSPAADGVRARGGALAVRDGGTRPAGLRGAKHGQASAPSIAAMRRTGNKDIKKSLCEARPSWDGAHR